MREDASLAAFYLCSLALGVLIVSVRGNSIDLLHVLFGTVLALDDHALMPIGAIAAVSTLVLAVIYRQLVRLWRLHHDARIDEASVKGQNFAPRFATGIPTRTHHH